MGAEWAFQSQMWAESGRGGTVDPWNVGSYVPSPWVTLVQLPGSCSGVSKGNLVISFDPGIGMTSNFEGVGNVAGNHD